jgi:ribosomal protein S27AE
MEVVREGGQIETEMERQNKGEMQLRREKEIFCPLCNVFAGRRIRNKLYCGNCGFVES